MQAKLEDIIEAIDFDMMESTAYLNLKTGKVVVISEEAISDLESDGESNPAEWWQDELATTKAFLDDQDSYLELPTKYDFHEYRVMEQFIWSLDDEKLSDKLENAIRGKGAFRRFKDTLDNHDQLQSWYSYREQRLEAFVREWCELEDIQTDSQA